MHTNDLIALFSALQAEQVRFIVVGGYAVIAHGHIRTTLDLDIVVDFAQAKGLVRALDQLGYRPRVPVPLSDLGDLSKRTEWIEDKEAQVFTVVKDKPQHAECDILPGRKRRLSPPFPMHRNEREYSHANYTGVAFPSVSVVFLEEPFTFDDAYNESLIQDVPGIEPIHIVDYDRLIVMKKRAARPKDIADISALEAFHRG